MAWNLPPAMIYYTLSSWKVWDTAECVMPRVHIPETEVWYRWRFRGSMKKVLALFLFALASAGGAFAQAAGGLSGISGIVRDPTGAVVPNAQVVVSNESRGLRLTLHTSDGGVFSAPPEITVLYGRYVDERSRGVDMAHAVRTTLRTTMPGVFMAMRNWVSPCRRFSGVGFQVRNSPIM